MTHVRVKPAREGEVLHHPHDGPLAAEGGLWRRDQFTFKRLRDRDVVEVDENGRSIGAPSSEAAAGPLDDETRARLRSEGLGDDEIGRLDPEEARALLAPHTEEPAAGAPGTADLAKE